MNRDLCVDCPHCGEALNGLAPVQDVNAVRPKNGDRTLCTMCAGVGMWDTVDGALALRLPTEDEQTAIQEDKILQSVRALVLSRLN